MNSPFVFLNAYWLMSVFHITLTVVVIRYLFGMLEETNIVMLLVMSSLTFWELLVTGHDLIAIGFLFVLFLSLVFLLSEKDDGRGITLIVLLGIAVGVFSTCRIVFACFPVLLSIFLWKFSRKNAVAFFFPSTFVCGALHGYFYSVNDCYQPFHLFGRGSNHVGAYLSIGGLLLTLVALCIVYYKLENTYESWMQSFFICLSIPLAAIAIGELVTVNFQLGIWEGANYLMPATPILLFWVANRICNIES